MAHSSMHHVREALNQLITKNYGEGGLARQAFQDDLFLSSHINLQLPPKTGLRIDAHGLTKGTLSHQLDFLATLLTDGIDQSRSFYTAPLSGPDKYKRLAGAGTGTGDGCAYKESMFIAIADPSASLTGHGPKDGIKAVLVNDVVRELMPALREAFPKTDFVLYSKINNYLHTLGVIDGPTKQRYNAKIEASRKKLKHPIAEAAPSHVPAAFAFLEGEELPTPPNDIKIVP